MEGLKIEYLYGWTEYDDWETPRRGYREDVVLTTSEGRRYQFSFYDPVRLQQAVESGGPLIEMNLVVIQEVNRVEIERLLAKLVESGVLEKLYKAS